MTGIEPGSIFVDPVRARRAVAAIGRGVAKVMCAQTHPLALALGTIRPGVPCCRNCVIVPAWRIVNLEVADLERELRFRPHCACYSEWYGSATCAYHVSVHRRRAALLASIEWRDVHGWEGDDS